MRPKPWRSVAVLAPLLLVGLAPAAVEGQTVEELKRRIQELERSTREQVDALRRLIEQQEAERARERQAQEQRERTLEILKEQVEQQRLSLARHEERLGKFLDGWENFFDLQAGAKQGADAERAPLGKDIQGNVFTGDRFKVRLGGSLRLHVQRSDTPVGESVSRALLPDAAAPGGGNEADRDNFRAFAGRTRFNLAIEGPVTLGGRTSAFFEFDFNRLLQTGEAGSAINPNPRLRHAFGRWRFDNLLLAGDELSLTLGQTTSFADNVPDTVDFNTMLGGLGAALRRNPRLEVVHRAPLAKDVRFVSALGAERPVFDNQFLSGGDVPSNDLGGGSLSAFPTLSAGIGLETGRLGILGRSALYLRTTWGEFEERFVAGTTTADFNREVGFTERTFTNQSAWLTFDLDRIGFNQTGRAGTARLKGGLLWTRGEARHLNAEFDRRVILDDGDLTPAQSLGAFINPMIWLTDTLSLRLALGTQWALDPDRPVATGSLITADRFFRVNNRQGEISLWWTPGPFTFAIAYNHTATNFRRVFPAGGSESRENENNKFEFITWFSF